MTEKPLSPTEVVGMAAVLLLFACIFLTIVPGWHAIASWLDSPQAPAWVQGVGSIAAIAATAGLFFAQGRREAAIRRAEEAARLRDQSEFALIVLGETLNALFAFERRWTMWRLTEPWLHDGLILEEVADFLKQAALLPTFPEARSVLIDVRGKLLLVIEFSTRSGGYSRGKAEMQDYINKARDRIMDGAESLNIYGGDRWPPLDDRRNLR